jgi:Flp pilus assembly pilin Flp
MPKLKLRSSITEKGATFVEYGLILACVMMIALGGVTSLSTVSRDSLEEVFAAPEDGGDGGDGGDGDGDPVPSPSDDPPPPSDSPSDTPSPDPEEPSPLASPEPDWSQEPVEPDPSPQ